MLVCTQFDTPVGVLNVAAEGDELRHIEFPSSRHAATGNHWKWVPPEHAPDVLRAAHQQLREYFAGQRKTFDLPLAPRGTAFQLRVWQTLASIPFARTWSYQQLAAACGNPKAMRAVGAACGRNPLPIVLPCHRVLGADGSLTGFAGGLEVKATLLRLERAFA